MRTKRKSTHRIRKQRRDPNPEYSVTKGGQRTGGVVEVTVKSGKGSFTYEVATKPIKLESA